MSANVQSSSNTVTNTNVNNGNQINVMVPPLNPWLLQLRYTNKHLRYLTKRIINEINTRIYEHKKQMGILTRTFLYHFSYSNQSLDVRKNKRAKCHNQHHYHHLILLPLIKTQCYTYPYLLTQQVATQFAAKKMFLGLNWIIWYDFLCNSFVIIIFVAII